MIVFTCLSRKILHEEKSHFFPVELFDDERGEIHTPEQWVAFGSVCSLNCFFEEYFIVVRNLVEQELNRVFLMVQSINGYLVE